MTFPDVSSRSLLDMTDWAGVGQDKKFFVCGILVPLFLLTIKNIATSLHSNLLEIRVLMKT